MKGRYPKVNLVRFCRLLGVTRQAYYQYYWESTSKSIEEELVLKEVLEIRRNHKHMGGRKMYELIAPFMLEHQIKMGRDALFDLLSENKLLVRKKRRRVYTTQSFHWLHKFPNIIRGFVPTASNQLWVSDITYWKISTGFVYISFITDAFSHKIVGYHLANTLESIETVLSLKMALLGLIDEPDRNFQLIHHSDRGIQYCSKIYVDLLNKHNIKISMTENGDPLENAIAERINGIIKEEYLCDYKVGNLLEAKEVLDFVVKLYNEERPHNSIGNLFPNQVHKQNLKTEKLWKSYYRKNPIIVNQF